MTRSPLWPVQPKHFGVPATIILRGVIIVGIDAIFDQSEGENLYNQVRTLR